MLSPLHIRLTFLAAAVLQIGLLCEPLPGSYMVRSWTEADGLGESYSLRVRVGPDGAVWAAHGVSQGLSVLDGYHVRRVASTMADDYDLAVHGEAGWTLSDAAVDHWNGREWVQHPSTEIEQLSFVARVAARLLTDGPDRAFVLLDDRLLFALASEERPRTVLRPAAVGLSGFSSLARAPDGDIWIAGPGELVKVAGLPGEAIVNERAAIPSGLVRVERLSSPSAGELLVTAQLSNGKAAAYDVVEGSWRRLIENDSPLVQVWKQPSDGSLWIRNKDALFTEPAEGEPWIELTDLLPGRILDVGAAPDGSIWVGSTHGLHRISPAVWQAPEPERIRPSIVHAATPDRLGRTWFAAHTQILLYAEGRWESFDLPEGERTSELQTQSIGALSDGRIAFKLESEKGVVVLDPATKRFEVVSPPESFQVRLTVPRAAGGMWVNTSPADDPFAFRLQIFDGASFQTYLDRGRDWGIGHIRYLLEDEDRLWIGGTAGLACYGDGQYRVIENDGAFARDGAFALARSPEGTLLVAGRSKLHELSKSGWRVLSDKFGKIRSMLFDDDGRLWLAGEKGVHLRSGGTFITMGSDEGLPADVAYLVASDNKGRIFAGTHAGIARYQPFADQTPPVVEIRTDSQGLEFPSHGFARLDLAAADRWKVTTTNRLLYSHSLDDGEWSEYREESQVRLSNVGEGRHTLRARVLDRNGNLGVSKEPIHFAVALSWYRQPTFLVLSSLAAALILLLTAIATINYRRRGAALEDLAAAKREAEKAAAAKGTFLANMSHEIRTPMNGIIGITELLLDYEMPRRQRRLVEVVSDSSKTLLTILNAVLDFSKLEAGKIALERVPFRLRDHIGRTLHLLGAGARRKSIRLICRVPPDVPDELEGDSDKLRQILFNLIGNAVKFTEIGEVYVEVRALASDADAIRLELAVTDTGIGIPSDKQSAVFEAFEQADSSTSRRFGGTGLGLAISMRLARAMGGEITMESPQRVIPGEVGGAGTTFRIELPFLVVADSAAKSPVDVGDVTELIVAAGNDRERKSLADLARFLGIAAREAGDAAELERLAAACDRSAALVVGDELVVAARKAPTAAKLPRIVLSDSPRFQTEQGEQQLRRPADLSGLRDCLEDLRTPPAVQPSSLPQDAKCEDAAAAPPCRRILLAEDNPVNQLVAVKTLEKHGCLVDVVENGAEALDKLQKHSYDVVLMDMHMPVMDGMQAIRRIRAGERGGDRRQPVIAVTASALEGDREEFLDAGADDYVSKPIQFHLLLAAIERVIKARSAVETAPSA